MHLRRESSLETDQALKGGCTLAEAGLPCRVDVQILGSRAQGGNHFLRVVEQVAVSLFTLAQGMLSALGGCQVGGDGQQSGQRTLGVPDRGEINHGGKGGRILAPAEDLKAADSAHGEAGDVLYVVLQLRGDTVQVDGRGAIQARNQQLSYALQFAFREEIVRVELAHNFVEAVAEHPFGGGIEDEQVAFEVGGQNHRAGGVQDASLQLGYLLHLPFRFILAGRIEKAVHAQSDQQHLGAGPSDHGAGEGAASAQQQDQSAIGGEQQRNREKYGGWKPISKPGHSCSIDAGLINELSPSQSSNL